MNFVFLTAFVVSADAYEQMRADLSSCGWELSRADYGTHDRRFEARAPQTWTNARAVKVIGEILSDCGVAAEVRYFQK